MAYTILNTVIDQIVRPSMYAEKRNPENPATMHRNGFWKIPSELLEVLQGMQTMKTPDPYVSLGLRTGFITKVEVETGKLPETWSMRKILNNFGIDPEQTLITSKNATFRDNNYKVGTISGFLYRKLSNKENPKQMLFTFDDIYKQFSYHNYLIEIVSRVAKRYVEDYGITGNSRQKIHNYHLQPTANATNRKKVSTRIQTMMKNKKEPEVTRINSRSETTMKLIEDNKKEREEFDYGD